MTTNASGISQTGGYEIFRQAGPEGSGPPPHCHPWDESFYVVSGNIAFGVGDKDMIAEPGTLVHLPAGTMHWFRFGKGGGELISMTSREAASHLFTDIHRAISPDAPDIRKLVEVANQHQVTVAALAQREDAQRSRLAEFAIKRVLAITRGPVCSSPLRRQLL